MGSKIKQVPPSCLQTSIYGRPQKQSFPLLSSLFSDRPFTDSKCVCVCVGEGEGVCVGVFSFSFIQNSALGWVLNLN